MVSQVVVRYKSSDATTDIPQKSCYHYQIVLYLATQARFSKIEKMFPNASTIRDLSNKDDVVKFTKETEQTVEGSWFE